MPNFSQSGGFKMNMGSKQKETEGSFSEDSTALLKMTPIYKALVGNQPNLPEYLQTAIKNTPKDPETPIKAIRSEGIDGGAAYEDTTTDSVAEAQAEADSKKEGDESNKEKAMKAMKLVGLGG